MKTAMQNNRWNRVLRLAGTAAAFVLMVVLLSRQGWDQILDGVREIPAWYFPVAIILMLLSRLAVAVRWHALLRAAGVPILWRDSLRITFAGLFASNFLPTTIGGDVVRLAMGLRLDLDKVILTASLIVDRLVGMAGMATAAPLGLVYYARAGGTSAVSLAASPGFLGKLSSRLRSVWERLVKALQVWLRSPRGLLAAYGWTWLHQFALFGVIWLMLIGLGETIPYWQVGGLWSLTYFITLLPVSINGLGLQEISMTAIFSSLGGVSLAGAATAALLVRTIQMLASLPGAISLPDILAGGGRRAEGDA